MDATARQTAGDQAHGPSLSLQRSKPELLHQLYQEHARAVRRALLRLGVSASSADDVTQEVFIVAFRRLDDFDPQRSARAWLLGIAVKLAASHRRKNRLRTFLGLEVADQASSDPTPERSFEQLDARRRVDALLQRMSPRKREVLVLFELEGLSGEEISLALGCPVKTVWTRLIRARIEFVQHLRRAELSSRDGDGH